ncbi:MAG: alpha/beta hydrolase family protein [Isosphaeraceae bacterium]
MAFATVNYFSRSLQKASSIAIVFPDDPAISRPWSTYYLLHGLSDDHTIWMRRTSIERYVAGLPLVVVMPDGGRGFYTNAAAPGGLAYEDDLIKDVMPLVERTFPVKAERAGRAIGGLSMGGYGAIKLGLKHHERFASVNSHSGALGLPRQLARDDGLGPLLQAVFGPNGVGSDNDLYALLARIDHGRIPALRIDCGVDDFLIEDNRALHKHLESIRVPHEYAEYPGGHNWEYWDEHVKEAIAFHVKNLGLKKP